MVRFQKTSIALAGLGLVVMFWAGWSWSLEHSDYYNRIIYGSLLFSTVSLSIVNIPREAYEVRLITLVAIGAIAVAGVRAVCASPVPVSLQEVGFWVFAFLLATLIGGLRMISFKTAKE
jgi:hypothetical protein